MKKLFLFSSSFCPDGTLNLLKAELAQAGYDVVEVTHAPVTPEETLRMRASWGRSKIPVGTQGAFALGLSSGGAVLQHLINDLPNGTFSKVQLFGCPMLDQNPLIPVWGTFFHYLVKGHLFRAIWGKGIGFMTQNEAEYFLFNGSHELAEPATKVGEAWSIIREMIFGKLPHMTKSTVQYVVTVVSKEKFHRNSGAKSWAKKSDAQFQVLEGSHFGVLLNQHTVRKIISFFN